MLGDTADENMFEPRQAMGRSDDEVKIIREGEVTYLFDRRPDCNLAVRLGAPEPN